MNDNIKPYELDKKYWLQFVRELRTIELTKMNSLFKISAVIIFIITIVNKFLLNINDIISAKNNMFLFFLFIASAVNFKRGIYYILNSIYRKGTIRDISEKRFNRLDRQCLLAGYVCEIINAIVSLGANYYVYINISVVEYKITLLPYLIFIAIYLSEVIVKIIIFFKNYVFFNIKIEPLVLNKENINNIFREARDFEASKLYKLIYKIKTIFYVILINTLAIFILKELFEIKIIINKYNIFINSLSIIAILICLEIISMYIANKIRYSWLVKFEKQILFEKLDCSTIANILNTEFFSCIEYDYFYYSDDF